MRAIGGMIAAIIHDPESEEVKAKVRRDVAELTAKFPMYPGSSSSQQSAVSSHQSEV